MGLKVSYSKRNDDDTIEMATPKLSSRETSKSVALILSSTLSMNNAAVEYSSVEKKVDIWASIDHRYWTKLKLLLDKGPTTRDGIYN